MGKNKEIGYNSTQEFIDSFLKNELEEIDFRHEGKEFQISLVKDQNTIDEYGKPMFCLEDDDCNCKYYETIEELLTDNDMDDEFIKKIEKF